MAMVVSAVTSLCMYLVVHVCRQMLEQLEVFDRLTKPKMKLSETERQQIVACTQARTNYNFRR